jgi:CheY-like chemotaxis protein
VKDEGVGMPEEVQGLLFQPFFSTKGEHGCGLGLSVCRSIAQRHGGKFTVQSVPGHGSTFTLSLPQAPAELLTPALPEVEPHAAASPLVVGRRILLVDDQGEVRDSVGQMLRALGHHVVAAADGQAGLEIALGQRVDLVLTDFGMPGMNGVEFARRMASVAPHVPVVLITGWGLDQDAPPPANVAFVLGKPITMKDLREAIAACTAEGMTVETEKVRCS